MDKEQKTGAWVVLALVAASFTMVFGLCSVGCGASQNGSGSVRDKVEEALYWVSEAVLAAETFLEGADTGLQADYMRLVDEALHIHDLVSQELWTAAAMRLPCAVDAVLALTDRLGLHAPQVLYDVTRELKQITGTAECVVVP